MLIEELPLLVNGKVDRQKLLRIYDGQRKQQNGRSNVLLVILLTSLLLTLLVHDMSKKLLRLLKSLQVVQLCGTETSSAAKRELY